MVAQLLNGASQAEQFQMKNGGQILMTRHFCLLMLTI